MSKGLCLMRSNVVEVMVIAFVNENMTKTFTARSRQVTDKRFTYQEGIVLFMPND